MIVSTSALYQIKNQLLAYGISEENIITKYMEQTVNGRITFVKNFSKIVTEYGLCGAIAEAGVFQGEFAKILNEQFPDRNLYLFDTFEGFDSRDIEYEKGYSYAKTHELNMTSEQLVLNKMKYKEMCIIKKGYFPETAQNIYDKFCFVNLDMDLYKPTFEGLNFFWPKMVKGGIILIHDYFSFGYYGVNQAVKEFSGKLNILPFPIGDGISIAFKR